MNRSTRGRTILAFAIAPAVVPAIVAGLALAEGIHLRESLVVASVYGAFTYGAALLLGAPAFAALSRRGWTLWWHYAILGAVIGVLVLLGLSVADDRLLWDWRILLVFLGVGVLTAMTFWLIAVRESAEPKTGRGAHAGFS